MPTPHVCELVKEGIQTMELLYLRKVEGGTILDRAPNKDNNYKKIEG